MILRSSCRVVSVVLSLALVTPSVRATDWYVDQNDPNCPTGTGGPGDPFCAITDALNVAADGDTIHIAPGTYFENLVIGKSLKLIGTSGRDLTIVDGAQISSVILIQGGVMVEIVGLTVTGGLSIDGGGLNVGPGCTLVLADSKVHGNTATGGYAGDGSGGGIFVNQATAVVTSSIISGNLSETGGGIDSYRSELTIADTSFLDNTAFWPFGFPDRYFPGAAVTNREGTTRVSRSLVSQNVGRSALHNSASTRPSTLTITSSDICNNVGTGVSQSEGTVELNGVRILGNSKSGIQVTFGTMQGTGCIVRGNQSSGIFGFGSFFKPAHLVLTRSIIRRNEVHGGTDNEGFDYDGEGGGVQLNWYSTGELTDCELSDNVADDRGGGVFVKELATVSLVRCTVAGNQTTRADTGFGGGLFVTSGAVANAEGSILAGNLSSNASTASHDCSGTLTSGGYNLIGDTAGCTLVGDTTGNLLNVDPKYRDPGNGDYSLLLTSPALDTGNPADQPVSADVTGNPRILDGDLDRAMILDMGAHELDHVHLMVSGNATPGGTITLETSGTAGLAALLFIASAPGTFLLNPFGVGFFDLSSPWSVFPIGQVPSSINVMIPPTFPVPTTVFLQDLAIAPGSAGNFSNSQVVTIE